MQFFVRHVPLSIIATCVATLLFSLVVAYRHWAFPQQTLPSIYDANRTAIVDQQRTSMGINFLVRGNFPLEQDFSLAYDRLAERLYILEGIELPKFNLIIVSLVESVAPISHHSLSAEFKAVGIAARQFEPLLNESAWPPAGNGINPAREYKGKEASLIWYPIVACVNNIECSNVERNFRFSKLIRLLSELMLRPSPTVIYVHCHSGIDRVASVIGAYQLSSLGRTLEEVLTKPHPVGAQLPEFMLQEDYKVQLQWFSNQLEVDQKEFTAQQK
jgi:hypothetical protein